MVRLVFWEQVVNQVVLTFYHTAQVNKIRDYVVGTWFLFIKQYFLLLLVTIVLLFLGDLVYSDADERFQNLFFHSFICEASLKHLENTSILFQSRRLLAT